MSAQSDPPSLSSLSLTNGHSTTNPTSPTSPTEPLQLSIPLPKTYLPVRIYIHLTINPTSILLFLTTRLGSAPQPLPQQPQVSSALADTNELAAAEAAGGNAPSAPAGLIDPFAAGAMAGLGAGPGAVKEPNRLGGVEMGSFVVAMPDLRNPTSQPYSTPLYIRESTLETTTRIARILAAKTNRPCYVGNSMDFGSAGLGGSVEEVMEGIKEVVQVVRGEVERADRARKGKLEEALQGEGV